MNLNRIEAALGGLDSEARALVELSLIRDVADEDIASLLGTDESTVRRRRQDAVAVLTTDLGASSGEEVVNLVRELREPPPERPTAGPEVVEPGARRRHRLGPALTGGILAAAAAVALVLALSSGNEDDGEPAGEAAAPAVSKPVKLAALAGSNGTGTARLRRDRLELSVSGLPDPGEAGYVVWLYDSLSEARPLNRPRSQSAFDLKAELPEGAGRYRFIDVSLEPADSNLNHSGKSVLRVPLSKLRPN